MRIVRRLRILLARHRRWRFAAPACAQTTQEDAAQAATADRRQPGDRAASDRRGEIIVTATKRASRVQDVPFSINAQTQEDIQRANAQTLEDISRNVAGLTVQNLGPGQSQVSVRGVSAGQIARDQPGVKEQVGVYLDETRHLAVAVHARFRPVRPQPRRDAARTAGHAVRLGQRRRHAPLHHQPAQRRPDRRAWSKPTSTCSRTATSASSLKGADQRSAGPHRGDPRRRLWHAFRRVHRFRSARTRRTMSTTAAASAAASSLLFQPTPELKITPRIVYQKVEAGGFNREDRYILFNNQFVDRRQHARRARAVSAVPREVPRQDVARRSVASYDFGPVELTCVTSYMDRDILVSRDASALTSLDDHLAVIGLGHRFGRDLPSVRTCATRPSSSNSRRNCASPRPARARSSGCSADFYSRRRPQICAAAADPGL